VDALVGDHPDVGRRDETPERRRIANAAESGESIHLFFDVHHTPFRYHGQVLLTHFRARRDGPSRFEFQLLHDLKVPSTIIRTRIRTGAARRNGARAGDQGAVGQGQFRSERLLSLWRGCAVTGVARPDLVRASHIKPWRMSNNEERLDPSNGLLLLPQYDHLFDAGFISFDDDGRLLDSPVLDGIPPSVLGFERGARLRRITDEHRKFLEFHRSRLFLRSA
jgi:predicted restriction endonuclease